MHSNLLINQPIATRSASSLPTCSRRQWQLPDLRTGASSRSRRSRQPRGLGARLLSRRARRRLHIRRGSLDLCPRQLRRRGQLRAARCSTQGKAGSERVRCCGIASRSRDSGRRSQCRRNGACT